MVNLDQTWTHTLLFFVTSIFLLLLVDNDEGDDDDMGPGMMQPVYNPN